jgi:hypothetical protein
MIVIVLCSHSSSNAEQNADGSSHGEHGVLRWPGSLETSPRGNTASDESAPVVKKPLYTKRRDLFF